MSKRRHEIDPKDGDEHVLKKKVTVHKKYNLRGKNDEELNKLLADEIKASDNKTKNEIQEVVDTITENPDNDVIVIQSEEKVETTYSDDYDNLVKIQKLNTSTNITNAEDKTGNKIEDMLENAKNSLEKTIEEITDDQLQHSNIINKDVLRTPDIISMEGAQENKINKDEVESVNDSEIIDDPLPKSK